MAGSEESASALEQAREDGRVQGMILQSLQDIKQTLEKMDKKHTEQDIKIDSKADRAEIITVRNDMEDVKKKVYMAMGGLAIANVALGVYLAVKF